MRKLMCTLLSVVLVGMTGCGQPMEEALEASNRQEPAAMESSVSPTETMQIEETENLTTNTDTPFPDVYTTGVLSVEEKEALSASGFDTFFEDNILQEEYESFGATVDAKDAEGFYKFDDFSDVIQSVLNKRA